MSTAVDSERTSLELVEDEHSEVVIGGATLGNTCFAGACARIGAMVQLAGLVEPLCTLTLLAEEQRIPGKKPKVSFMTTYRLISGNWSNAGSNTDMAPPILAWCAWP